MLDINELSKRTGLTTVYIRKCLNRFGELLSSYIQRGEFNRLLFDNNAIVFFDKIQQLKADGLSLPEIEKKLKDLLEQSNKSAQTNKINLVQTPIESGQTGELIKQLFDLYRELTEEKEKRIKDREESEKLIRDLEKDNQSLRDAFKLLPEGKSPEQIKAEWEEEQKQKLLETEKKAKRTEIIQTIKKTGAIRFLKRKKLLRELEELI